MKVSKTLNRASFPFLLSGVFIAGSVQAESLCVEPLALIRTHMQKSMNALSGLKDENLVAFREILSRPIAQEEYQQCLKVCERSSGTPEKCPRVCENEDAAVKISDAALKLTGELGIPDLIEAPASNFFAGFFLEVPALEKPAWGYEISLTDPQEKHPYSFSWITRERYVLESAPGKSWKLSRCTIPAFYPCGPEIVSSDVLEAMKACQ